MAKNRYELLKGFHRDGPVGAEVTYKEGDVVESDYELDKLFANKFKKLMGKKRHARDEDEEDEDFMPPEPTQDEQAEARRKVAEDAAEEAEEDDERPGRKAMTLVEEIPEKKGAKKAAGQKPAKGEGSKKKGTDKPKKAKDEEEPEKEGEDVTTKFPEATEGGLTVMKTKEGYVVKDGPKKVGGPFTKKSDTQDCVSEHLEG